jgi:hypothetical protein
VDETQLALLKNELEYLKNWQVGLGSTVTDVGNKMLASIELNLKVAEALLKAAKASGGGE